MIDADRDLLFVAMTADEEARNQGRDGIRAQVHSVLNRHAAVDANGKPRWYCGKTLAGTVVLKFAYSAWNTSDPNRQHAAEIAMDSPEMAMCLDEAEAAIAGLTADPTGGATHYYVAGTPVPAWAEPATGSIFTVQIGVHRYYRSVA